MSEKIYYAPKYYDKKFEYRHVILPKELAKLVPDHLMTENEWRSLGLQQSQGWIHYMFHKPERHILLFRRPIMGPAPTQIEQAKLDVDDMEEN